jgi:hypothetical protein
MQEQRKREESLSEELLDRVTGAGSILSTSKNPGPGSFLDCADCQSRAVLYGRDIYRRDRYQAAVDQVVAEGHPAHADIFNEGSSSHHRSAQQRYQDMAAHGHPDFPAALGQQRQNYNPPL